MSKKLTTKTFKVTLTFNCKPSSSDAVIESILLGSLLDTFGGLCVGEYSPTFVTQIKVTK